ncbi:hypothetical protein N7537_004235 [Penicillium hordei]|uniref:Uncharacterized protein n=1 Tax=Penicillium hordei TaxID=40994 RepID=A0AAD6H4R0_9EURO|nr:uncharacterized protein N7537_004235 [Penicillium hordei]KAJ5607616.1 hypothetical protein N7537_004235 [Penicillium hordei]
MLRLPMNQSDPLHDYAVAPSPIVRTYRPDPPSKRRLPNMTSTKTGPPPQPLVTPRPRGGSAPRPEARSAGTAERAGRNENLVDMVRFFQTQNMPSQTSPPSQPRPRSRAPSQPQPSSPSDTTTALPIPISPKESKPESKPDPKQDVKPFRRRLLQFGQRQKKESSPRSKEEDQRRQIEALTRGGYLIPASALPKESKGQKEAKRSKESLSLSLSRSLSRSKKDVETIGQPWLQAKVDTDIRPTETRRRLGSLNLDDFGSMVDVAVSLTSDFDDSMPPPYQSTDHSTPQSPPAIPTSGSMADLNSQNITRPASSLAPTSHSYKNESIDEQIQRPSSSAESDIRADPVSRVTTNASVGLNGTQSQPRSSIDNRKRTQPEQSSLRNVTPLSPTLKLFPDVAPPRKSSKDAWRNSSIPRYQTIENTTASPASPASSSRTGPSDNVPEVSDEAKKPSDGLIDAPVSKAEPKCSGALTPSTSSSAAALSTEKAPENSTSQDETKIRPLSLCLGTLQAFPLPAPTRPLPSLPKAKCSPIIQDGNAQSIRAIDSEPLSSILNSPSATLVEEHEIKSAVDNPCALGSRPVTALGSVDAGDSVAEDEESLITTSLSEHYQPTPEHCTPRGRVSSVRIPRMQELPESPSSQCDEKVSEGQPLADSPVLGHSLPTKSNGKRAALKELQINSQVSRNNLPFGLPSPPPTASLPSAPPQHPPPPPPGRKVGQRNYIAPNVAIPPPMRNIEAHPLPGPYRGSTLSRSDSSGSSLRHESFPETYQQSRPESRPESPLPSSDDEVFGPGIDTKHSRREADNYHHLQPTHRGYETRDPRQMPSRNRLRYPNPARPMTPQSRSTHKTSSPQSQYSQSTHRSRESQSSRHTRAPQMDHYLEDRVANLERQNQILQAALMAALNAGVKNPLEGLNLDPNLSSGPSHAPFTHQYPGRHSSRPDSWVSSSYSSEHSGFEASSSYRDTRPNVKQLDNMIEDIESGWLSDKSGLSGTRIARKR